MKNIFENYCPLALLTQNFIAIAPLISLWLHFSQEHFEGHFAQTKKLENKFFCMQDFFKNCIRFGLSREGIENKILMVLKYCPYLWISRPLKIGIKKYSKLRTKSLIFKIIRRVDAKLIF